MTEAHLVILTNTTSNLDKYVIFLEKNTNEFGLIHFAISASDLKGNC